MNRTAEVPADNQPYVFVSYASADRERVLPLADALTRAGVPVWIDREGIHGGANYGREIAGAIKEAAAFVLMASAMSLASRNVKQEIAVAWEYERPYLPLLLEPVAIPDDLKYWLTAAQWVEVLDTSEATWLPQVLAALAPLGIAPVVPIQEEARLAGREKELGLLREKLAAAKDGRGGLILIGGEAGIGKTTLAEAVMRGAANEGFALLEGHCFDLAETPPYGPFIDLFLHLPDARAMPPLPEAFAQRGTVGAVASQMALFAQVEDFLTALAHSRPVIVLLDDLHWADPASLDLVRFLARSVGSLPLLMLITYRSDELTRRHPLYALLPHLAREASAARLDLGRLDDDAVYALVDGRYGLPDGEIIRLTAYLRERAEGNALFVGELLRALEEAGVLRQEDGDWLLGDLGATGVPALLRQVIDGRLNRLGEDAERLLAIAAVIGYEVPLDIWATVGECGEDEVLTVAERGLDARLLLEGSGGERVRFAHALVREALYEGIPGIRRRRLHRRVAEALAAAPQPDPDAVAYHFQHAEDERALPWLLEAGARAQAAYAWVTAAERFEAALALMERADAGAGERGWLLLRLARLLSFVSVAKARAFAEESCALGESAANRALAATARFWRGLFACIADDVAYGLSEMEAGADAMLALSDTERAEYAAGAATIPTAARVPEERGAVVTWRTVTGRYREARALGERLIAEGIGVDVGGLAEAYAALGMPDEAAAMYARAQDANIRAGHHVYTGMEAARMLAMFALPYRAEDIAGRRRLAEWAEAEWEQASGALSAAFPPRALRLPLLVLEGQWDEAERLANLGGAAVGTGSSRRKQSLMHLAELANVRGDAGRARRAVRECLPHGSATEPGAVSQFDVTTGVQRAAVALALCEGDLSSTREWLEAHDRWLAWSGAVLWQSEGQALWAQYYRQSGDREHAYAHAERALAHASEPRQPLALLAAHRLFGELDTESGTYDDAARHLGASLQLAEACEAPYERALTLLAMAELRAATGEANTARTLLDEVTTICEPLGAKPALARAEALLATLGDG